MTSARRLRNALLPLFGADGIVWTTDVAGLDPEAGPEVLTRTARALDQATIDQAVPSG